MSYHKRYGRRRLARGGMGDVTSTIGTVATVATDPYFAEMVCRVQQLIQIDGNQPVQTCTDTPDGYPGGVGLRNAMPALRAYVYAQQNPWVYPLAIAAIVGLPMLIGYELGKDK